MSHKVEYSEDSVLETRKNIIAQIDTTRVEFAFSMFKHPSFEFQFIINNLKM